MLLGNVTGFGFIILVAGPGGVQNSWKPAGQRPRPFLAHDTWRAFARTTSGRRGTRKAALGGLACGMWSVLLEHATRLAKIQVAGLLVPEVAQHGHVIT